MNEVGKWKIAVEVFVVAFMAVLVVSDLAFNDLKKASDSRIGSSGVLGGFFYGLANAQLAEGDMVNYEYRSDVPLLFVVRLYNDAPPYEYEGIEVVNTTGASGSGEFGVPTTGFYVFQVLASEQAGSVNVDYRFYKYVHIGPSRPYSEAGITVVLFVVSVAVLVAGRRYAIASTHRATPSLAYWWIFVTNWQNWSPGIAGLSVVMATMLIRFSSPEQWSSNALEWASWFGGTAAFWGVIFGLTHIPRSKTKHKL